MSDEEKPKSNIHINLGGLVVIIIIVLILFKVDIKSKINSPQFQKNITYIEDFFKGIWEDKIKGNFEKGIKDFSDNLVNTGIEEVQDTVNTKLDGMKKE
jgi:hypothetical protein